MNWKNLALLCALMMAPTISARTFGDDAPMQSLCSSGDVTTGGSLIVIPGVTGSTSVTTAVVVANDSATDTLLVATNVLTATAGSMPVPPNDITSMSKVIPVLPGEKLSLNQGTQTVGLRAVSGTIPARVIVTFR